MDGIHGSLDSEDRMIWKAEEEPTPVALQETKSGLGGEVTQEVGRDGRAVGGQSPRSAQGKARRRGGGGTQRVKG